jgi:hypothetical protein
VPVEAKPLFRPDLLRLTPEEIALMWKTAPPRMPIPRPNLA